MTEQPVSLDAALEALPPASEAQGGRPDPSGDRARAIRALTLRTNGATWEQIAERMHYADGSGPRQLVNRTLDRREAESVAEYRELENARMDRDEAVLAAIISGVVQDVTITNGEPVRTNRASTVTERLRAIDARTRLNARRSRMNGLDAPIAVQISAGVAVELEDALASLEQLMAGSIPGEVITVTDEAPEP